MVNTDMIEADMMGLKPVYDYTQYSHDHNVNVIPEEDFKHLVSDTFKVIADTLRTTYGPYGSTVLLAQGNEITSTKDGHNVFEALGFSNHYKRNVYLTIKKIIDRVNDNVGDGTTTCIILAEKMFYNLNGIISTAEDKRNVLLTLNKIESFLTRADNHDDKYVSRLNNKSFSNLINVADNYDNELTNYLADAFAPTFDEFGNIIRVRNVVTDAAIDTSCDGNMYAIDYLPGKYRVRVNLDVEFGLMLGEPTSVKLALYDHAFTASDWNGFIKDYNPDDSDYTLILARAFNRSFMDNEYVRFLKTRMTFNKPIKVILCEIKGNYVQDEISDLAALLNIQPIGLKNTIKIDHNELPVTTVSVYKGNALCFYDVTSPVDYVNILEQEMKKDLSKSLIKKSSYISRLNALKLETEDSLITIKTASSLENKMLCDKIDDCVAIVNSAMVHGVVPNMLQYVHYILSTKYECDDIDTNILAGITTSITELFNDVWASKYYDRNNDEMSAVSQLLIYNTKAVKNDCMQPKSYNIVTNESVQKEELPTSAQYDLEVVTAAISIVKYLLTSSAFIFDAMIMKPTDDIGHYRQEY